MSDITVESVKKEIRECQEAKYHRGKSWEHCYVFFRRHKQIRNDKELLDKAALHLGFFLASFGMLRASSFLIKRDYKFYLPIIEILLRDKYEQLWNVGIPDDIQIELIFDLKHRLEEEIKNLNKSTGDNENHQTDMIISKILMATIGCVPAYDRFFMDGVGHGLNGFNKKSFKKLIDKIQKDANLKRVCDASINIQDPKHEYPPMKLVDLYFWLKGYYGK